MSSPRPAGWTMPTLADMCIQSLCPPTWGGHKVEIGLMAYKDDPNGQHLDHRSFDTPAHFHMKLLYVKSQDPWLNFNQYNPRKPCTTRRSGEIQ
jgi:hypothetical protein